MGLAVLDPEFSRPMLPWVVSEVIFRADARLVRFLKILKIFKMF